MCTVEGVGVGGAYQHFYGLDQVNKSPVLHNIFFFVFGEHLLQLVTSTSAHKNYISM